MVVGDEVVAVVLVLEIHPVLRRAQVVADVEAARGAYPAEDPHAISHAWPESLQIRFPELPDYDAAAGQPAETGGLGTRALRNTVLVLAAKVVARLVALVTVLA